MVEEFDLLEEVEVQFCDEECTESVWHGVKYSESLFCREKPKSELTVVIKEEGMMYFLTADIKEFAGLCRKHGWYIVSHQRFNEEMEIGMCLMEAGRHAGWYSLGRSKEWIGFFQYSTGYFQSKRPVPPSPFIKRSGTGNFLCNVSYSMAAYLRTCFRRSIKEGLAATCHMLYFNCKRISESAGTFRAASKSIAVCAVTGRRQFRMSFNIL